MPATLTQSPNETIEVHLHGELAKQCGKVWHLAVDSPAAAIRALRALSPQFLQTVRRLHNAGMVFKITTRSHEYDNTDLELTVGRNKRIDIAPVVRGAGAGVRFVVGLVIFAVGVYMWNPNLMMLGGSLMLGSIAEWMMPVPKKEEENQRKESWTVSGAINPSEQGGPVPIIYGEVITGGVPISAGLSAVQVGVNGNIDQSCSIGGNFDLYFRFRDEFTPGTELTGVTTFSVSTFNLDDPITYAWSYTGFSGTNSVVISGANTATAKLTIKAPREWGKVEYPGTISVSVTGRYRDVDGNLKTKTVTDTREVAVAFELWAGFGGS